MNKNIVIDKKSVEVYSKEQVQMETLRCFKGDQLATDVWIGKYCLRDKQGNLLERSPLDMHLRLAKELARVEEKYPNAMGVEEIFNLLDGFKYAVPQGSPMAGIGNDNKISTLSNCYVIPSPKDSYSGVLTTEREMIELMKRRGGVGFSLHSLRPKEMPTSSVSNKSSGVVLFGERYSRGTREVAQDGRRGALMLSLLVSHPDSESFIDSKMEENKITGANISVMITDRFMKCVKNNEDYEAVWRGYAGEFKRKINARNLWNKIIHNAWKSAEPGVIFWDNILRESPANCYGDDWKEVGTNPCSELPLCQYDSCRLLLLNLYSYVENPFTLQAKFNNKLFKEHVNKAQRLMDDLVDLEIEKIDRILFKIKNDDDKSDDKTVEINLWNNIRKKAVEGRRTGLGITAEGDMLAALGFRYGTKEATDYSVKIHKILAIESYKASIEMAKERGSFPIWDLFKEEKNPFVNRIFNKLNFDYQEDYCRYGRRNIANLTIAPAGSVSLMTQTTSGIEPVFLPIYKRRRKVNSEDENVNVTFVDEVGDSWEEYNVFHPKFVEWYRYYGKNLNGGKEKDVEENFQYWLNILQNYDNKTLNELVKLSPYYKATSNDVNWQEKVRMQGEVQKWIDHSISVTVNIPEETTEEIVKIIYETAYKSGCKGITVYREGSRSGVLISNKDSNKDEFVYREAFERPEEVKCNIHRVTALKQRWIVFIGLFEGKPYEVFAVKELPNEVFPHYLEKGVVKRIKSGVYYIISERKGKVYNLSINDHMDDDEQSSTREYSTMLRFGVPPKDIIEQVAKQKGSMMSLKKAISRVLKVYIKNGELSSESCPECGNKLMYSEGCMKCSCGYAKCG